MSEFTTADGIRIYYESKGSGSPILFVHEFGGDYRSWTRQVDALSSDHRCITYSARGFWPSDAPDDETRYGQTQASGDLVALMDHLQLDAAHLVGTSMGSFTSLDVALANPGRVHSLTLVGNSSGPRDAAERDHYRKTWIGEEVRLRETRGQAGAVEVLRQDPAYQSFQQQDPDGWAVYAANLEQQPVHSAIHILKTLHWHRISLFDRLDRIRAFSKPVLLVTGDEDYYLVGETNRLLERTLPHCNHLNFEQTGHLANIERSQRFNETLRSHIAQPSLRLG